MICPVNETVPGFACECPAGTSTHFVGLFANQLCCPIGQKPFNYDGRGHYMCVTETPVLPACALNVPISPKTCKCPTGSGLYMLAQETGLCCASGTSLTYDPISGGFSCGGSSPAYPPADPLPPPPSLPPAATDPVIEPVPPLNLPPAPAPAPAPEPMPPAPSGPPLGKMALFGFGIVGISFALAMLGSKR